MLSVIGSIFRRLLLAGPPATIFGIFLLLLVLSSQSQGTTDFQSLIPQKDLPKGWTLAGRPQVYTKKNLFEHIDGQAELFFKYGFQKSIFATYQSKQGSQDQIDVDIYDMRDVIQAFGVFSRFRNEDRPGGFGLDSYLDDHSAFFYKSKYFVMLYASESNIDRLSEFSKLISSRIADPSPPPGEIGFFPKDGLKPGTIQYFPEGLLGHKFLGRGFLGTYLGNVEGKEFKVFLAIFKNSQEAMNARKAYEDDLARKGRISTEDIHRFGAVVLKGKDPYQGRLIVLQKGFYLLGALGFEKEEDAENRLAEFIRRVK